MNKTFACDTNLGSEALVCSFELDQQATGVSGLEFDLDLVAQAEALPGWWSYNAGECRPGLLSSNASTMPAGSVSCEQWAQGLAEGGIASYQRGFFAPASAHIVAVVGVRPSDLVTLDPGREYVALVLNIGHAKTVGTGACGGCDVPVCIFLQRIKVSFPYVAGQPIRDFFLDRGANSSGSQWVTWQNGYPINVQQHCFFPEASCASHYNSFDCVLATTGARGSTWGRVKSLYR